MNRGDMSHTVIPIVLAFHQIGRLLMYMDYFLRQCSGEQYLWLFRHRPAGISAICVPQTWRIWPSIAGRVCALEDGIIGVL